jgi:thiol-disulfide isomerase/thioredoxin
MGEIYKTMLLIKSPSRLTSTAPLLRGLKNIAIILLSALLLACTPKPSTVTSVSGHVFELQKYPLILVNYFAPWCKPCRTEIPEFDAFATAHPDVLVLGVSFDALPPEEIRAIGKSWKIHFPLLQTFPLEKYGESLPSVLPITIVIHDNKVIAVLKGPQTKSGLEKMLK